MSLLKDIGKNIGDLAKAKLEETGKNLVDKTKQAVEDAATEKVKKEKKKVTDKVRSNLTSGMKKQFADAVNQKCEMRCKQPAQHLHHIKPVKDGGENKGSNLIYLCGTHHIKAGEGKLTKDELKEVVKSRKPEVTKRIRAILKG